MAYSKEREAVWHLMLSQQENLFNTNAKLSLIKKGIYQPTPLQLRIESLFLSHKALNKENFLGDLSEQELICLLLTSWGTEVKEIGKILNSKEDSIHKFRARIAQKLNAKNVPNAVFRAHLAGLLTFDNVDFIFHPKKKKISTLQTTIGNKEVENAV